jgi:hypothetical protein
MNNFLFIIPRTPKKFRNPLREQLWQKTKISLLAQTYTNWNALVIDDQNSTEGNIQHINSAALKKGEKIQAALKIIETWKNKPDYVIRLDDDDIISPTILDFLKNKTFDVATDEYHTFYELHSGLFCQSKRPWFANTVAHKYEYAKTIMPDGRPLLDQDHSAVWHQFYSGRNIFITPKTSPLYCRVLSPSTVTSKADNNYLKYVQSFGTWNPKNSLKNYYGKACFVKPSDKIFRLKLRLNFASLIQRLKR